MKSDSRCMISRLWHLSKQRSICKREFGVLFGKTAVQQMCQLGQHVGYKYIIKNKRVVIFVVGGTKC